MFRFLFSDKLIFVTYGAGLTLALASAWLAAGYSAWLSIVVFAAIAIATVRWTHAGWHFKARARERDDTLMFAGCKRGLVTGARRLYRNMPSDPRCRVCLVPFGGVGRLLGVRPSRKNPSLCPS